MNKKIKIFLISIISLSGLFISFNNASAQTVVAHCNYATINGTVYPNGSPTYAWFDWGTTSLSNHTSHQGPFNSTSSYSEMITGLTPNTQYIYRAVAQSAGGTVYGQTKDFITPLCPVQTYTVSTSAGTGGTISPSSRQVNSGSTTWFTVAPNSGYHTNIVSGCNNGYFNGNTYTTGAIYSNCTVYATFSQNAPLTYTVSTSAGTGGTISPSSRQVNSGSTTTFYINANNGYSINSVTGCNGYLSGNTYHTGAINSNCSVYASFIQNQPTTYTVTATAGNGGYISPSLTIVNSGSTTTFYVSANNGYSINSVSGCNGSLSGNTYTTGPIYSNCTIYSTFTANEQNNEPTVTTKAATNIDEESATLNGSVDSNGGSNVEAWFEWGTNSNYSNHTNHINYGSTSGTNFDYDLEGLDSDETYYFRAVAQNNNGQKVYGNQKTFTTDEDNNNNNNDEPDVTTYSATDIESDSATLRGYVDTNGESTRRWFEWGTRSGSLYSETDKSSRSTSSRNFEDSIDGLNPNTTYYFRAVAENNNGTDYGNTLSFRTKSGSQVDDCSFETCAPTAVTTMATNIGQTSARLNGLAIVNNNNSTYVSGYFEYGRTQNLGNMTTNKNIGNNQTNAYFESVFNLASNTTYYYRAVVTNEYGTSVGSIVSFRTGNPITYTNTATNTNTVYRNVTVVSNTNDNVGNSRPSLVLLSVNQNRGNEILMRGDIVEYIINYKNVSSRNLRDIVLQISIPKELEFMETSRGYFSTENSTVVVNIGYLNPQEEGSVRVTVRVTTDAQIGKIVVVTANLAYTIIDNNTQEEVFAYAKNTIEDRGTIQLGALAFLFGNGFLPNSILGWLLLILLIILIILAVRRAYYGPRTVFIPQNIDKDHI